MHDTIPFWFPRSVDEEYGGFLTCFDRDGSLLQADKSVWFQGRFSWMLATLYNTVERREDWLRLARHGLDFIRERCFDTDGRMFFSLTREGRPLRKRRYVFSEVFAIIALAAYGQAARDDRSKKEALDLFKRVLHDLETPGALPPKTNPEVRPMKGLAIPMCLLVAAQEPDNGRPDSLFRLLTSSSSGQIDEVAARFHENRVPLVLRPSDRRANSWTTSMAGSSCPGIRSRSAGSSSRRPATETATGA